VGRIEEAGTGIQVRITTGGTSVKLPSSGIPDGSDVAGGTLTMIYSGPFEVELVDVGGNVLASGTLSVSE